MTAAPEIPTDVMAAAQVARNSVGEFPSRSDVFRVVAHAVLAERRRCVNAVNYNRPATQDTLSTSICDALDCVAHDIIQGCSH